ncbi:beta-1,3-galactosyltransferase GALT1 isoform X1 [Nicotiana sylvestris]|uniref:Beta-1,3-galactosyltransferase 15 n=1 Tax=Nicotiana sylvestris TaxID=4096 RepID=A0A1U7W680_NICSY|nr:PREDICTED: beta-1,3-galactosyltransferase 15 [Nicotiana sylvestris]XP_009774111.1 PREDICTED: beta-1,3-galactosyltransferase 15 [Nicotiana sylvestris]XP_009774112.1 PREDICTED: beta-1,3-galactosyltransferase 15 [Nicotiana sylvestris]XP_009774113.1 PREDICTED: beta-1,3-galactosyltransferase 15 [Nicotiana sylvestris]XP_009774114.1 PREDICTED: beta-1,3-galactosyltransferase 15 [Nicotiana sylvestris]XP_009774115.1 PREDICTED: beta-1,3-galactosyltransferase 15 [Nicotiana sylvestris]XP_009774116.1 PR
MKKWYGGVLTTSLLMFLVLGYCVMRKPVKESYVTSSVYFNMTNPLEWINAMAPPAAHQPEKITQVISAEIVVSDLFIKRNLSAQEQQSLSTWYQLKRLVTHDQVLPNAIDAVKEASIAWNNLMTAVEREKLDANDSSVKTGKQKQCPHFLSKTNATEIDASGFKLRFPCGLTQGSSITIIGIPNGLLGNFRIDLTGEPLPGEPDPPVILHYNVRLHGDKITEDPVIVQNTWTIAHDWGEEERCPLPSDEKSKKVDELEQCNEMVGNVMATRHVIATNKSSLAQDGSKSRKYFPFKQGYLSVATLRVGSEGIQMTVDGKHITSFAFRETLEPWLVSEVRISGDIKLISVVTSGLPTSEDSDHISDLEALKAAPLPPRKRLDLFVGVFSTANNFKRRMAVRRTWMQYDAVRSGQVAVRFFVGLHKNQMVNEELWNEARTYMDIQLMPFVDYYSLIAWKTIAICVFGTDVVSAKFVMKTDDDAFVRVDEILSSMQRINVTRGLLYGLINSDSHPHRSPDSKWFISPEEWPEETYPPWAHGPGYVVSSDIAKTISSKQRKGRLKMFKLEDVAMGIWISEMNKKGLEVKYEKEERIFNEGCRDGYVIAHYQGPREMLCLWQKIEEKKRALCCGE